jgi:UDP-galactose transporter B1
MSQPRHAVPVSSYASIAFSYIGAMYSSNLALNFMSYPAQSLAKSCKLIPVMLARMLLLGKRYSLHEYAQVALITAGIAGFMLFEDSKAGGKETSLLGLLLCLLSLALDGFTGPTQEKINAQYKPSSQ